MMYSQSDAVVRRRPASKLRHKHFVLDGDVVVPARQLLPNEQICADLLVGAGRYCCKSPKLLGTNLFVRKQKLLRSPINMAPNAFLKSPVSLLPGHEVSLIFTQNRVSSPEKFWSAAEKGFCNKIGQQPTRDHAHIRLNFETNWIKQLRSIFASQWFSNCSGPQRVDEQCACTGECNGDQARICK
jgi:hypothetical protein